MPYQPAAGSAGRRAPGFSPALVHAMTASASTSSTTTTITFARVAVRVTPR